MTASSYTGLDQFWTDFSLVCPPDQWVVENGHGRSCLTKGMRILNGVGDIKLHVDQSQTTSRFS